MSTPFPGTYRGTTLVPRVNEENWYTMMYQWGTGHVSDPWNTWIKPQIDAAASIGCTVIGLLFDPAILVGASDANDGYTPFLGTLTPTQFGNVIDQITNYLVSKGLKFYPRATYNTANGTPSFAPDQIETFLTWWVSYLSKLPTVIALDVCNEWMSDNATSGYNSRSNLLEQYIATARAALQRSIPITASFYATWIGALTANPADRSEFARLASIVDFFDIHLYPGVPLQLSDLSPAVSNAWSLPVALGEFGMRQALGDTAINNYYDSIAAIAGAFTFPLICQWSLTDQDSDAGIQYGAFAATQDGSSQFSAPRMNVITRLHSIFAAGLPTPEASAKIIIQHA